MADCGASGSALDRVLTSVVGGGGGGGNGTSMAATRGATKAISSFLGQSATATNVAPGGAAGMMMPTAAPNRIILPGVMASPSPPPPAAAMMASSGRGLTVNGPGDVRTAAAAAASSSLIMSAHAPQVQHQQQHPMPVHGTGAMVSGSGMQYHRPVGMMPPGPHATAVASHQQHLIAQQQQQHHQMQQMHMMQMQMAQMQHMSAVMKARGDEMRQRKEVDEQRKMKGSELDSTRSTTTAAEGGEGQGFVDEIERKLQRHTLDDQVAMDRAWEESTAATATDTTTGLEFDLAAEQQGTTTGTDVDINAWHDGLEEEWQREMERTGLTDEVRSARAEFFDRLQRETAGQKDDHLGVEDAYDATSEDYHYHEGNVEGVNIEELAKAWAEAEDLANSPDEHQAASPYELGEESRQLADRYSSNNNSETLWANEAAGPQPPTDLMVEGMQHFRDGQLKRAITCFEAELHLRRDNATAWAMLGRCHAENDEDRKAIASLEQAVEHDPYNLDALLALGVSYVNELDHQRALQNLRAWVEHNPHYSGLDVIDDGYGDGSVLDEVQNLLVQAQQFNPGDGDVLEALGVCHNVSQDYDAAVDNFRLALQSRPEDYALWNKLGATLANSNRSEEALPAYHRALQAKPRYARAWLNMAISHSNVQNYKEAARCYLQTLSLNPDAVHCWSYLRLALTSMERWDLLPFASAQNLAAFREHFDFVE